MCMFTVTKLATTPCSRPPSGWCSPCARHLGPQAPKPPGTKAYLCIALHPARDAQPHEGPHPNAAVVRAAHTVPHAAVDAPEPEVVRDADAALHLGRLAH